MLDVAKAAHRDLLLATAVTVGNTDLAEDDTCFDVNFIADNVDLGEGKEEALDTLQEGLLVEGHDDKVYLDPPPARLRKPPDKHHIVSQVEEALKFVSHPSVPTIVMKFLSEHSLTWSY